SVGINLIGTDPGAACLPAPIANSSHPMCDVEEDGVPISDCGTTAGATPCWQLLEDPTCLPVLNPRQHSPEQLALTLRPPAPAGVAVTARCLVIDARKK